VRLAATAGLLFVAWKAPLSAQAPGPAQAADTVFAEIQARVAQGDRAAARMLADSLLSVVPPGSSRYAEALYWRAFTASQAAAAERDYLRVSIEYPLSARAPDALLALAQLEYARGDRTAARRRFDRLLRDYPSGRHVARASYWSGSLALAAGDRAAACAAFANAQKAVLPDDVELANQIAYYVAQCATQPADSGPALSSGSAPASGGNTGSGGAAARAGEFSIQVAAYTTRADARALEARLRQRGFDVRVMGTRAPYRVRIGRYPTRQDAMTALARVRRSHPNAIVVDAVPR
jgi:cell division septation protein DedD